MESEAGQHGGLHGCIYYRNFENFKLNIRINIFNRSPIENVYSHILFLIFRAAAMLENLSLLGLKIDK